MKRLKLAKPLSVMVFYLQIALIPETRQLDFAKNQSTFEKAPVSSL